MLDVIEEAKREELKAKCMEMKVLPPTDIFIGLQVHDKGNLIFDDIQRGHSWTRNYWNYIYGKVSDCSFTTDDFGAGYISSKSFDDQILYGNWPVAYIFGGFLTSNATVLSGIVVGTGTAAFDIEQYTLDAIVENGNSAGKLYYNAGSVSSTVYEPTGKTWTVTGSRILNNNSGGSIVIAETGLFGYAGGVHFMFDRSLLSSAVTVPDGAQLTVTYTIVDDFSAID